VNGFAGREGVAGRGGDASWGVAGGADGAALTRGASLGGCTARTG
jgi:hypothetical protein